MKEEWNDRGAHIHTVSGGAGLGPNEKKAVRLGAPGQESAHRASAPRSANPRRPLLCAALRGGPDSGGRAREIGPR